MRDRDGTVRATCLVDSEAGTCRGGNGHAREHREVDGTLRTSCQRTRPQETSRANFRDQLPPRSQGAATERQAHYRSTCRSRFEHGNRALSGGCLRVRLTATAVCLCLATHCGRVGEWHLPHAATMSAGWHLGLPRLPTKEELLHATLQLLFLASTLQALSVAELRKRSSWASTSGNGQTRFRMTGFDNTSSL